MTSKLLKIINSSYFSLPRKVNDIKQVLVILGPHRTGEMILVNHIFESIQGPLQSFLTNFQEFSFKLAALAKQVAEKIDPEDRNLANTAFTGGMLHDIGKFILVLAFPKDYEKIQSFHNPLEAYYMEENIFQSNRSQVGAFFANLWHLSHEVIECISFHKCPAKSNHQDKITALSCVHIAWALLEEKRNNNLSLLDLYYLKNLNLTRKLPEIRNLINED